MGGGWGESCHNSPSFLSRKYLQQLRFWGLMYEPEHLSDSQISRSFAPTVQVAADARCSESGLQTLASNSDLFNASHKPAAYKQPAWFFPRNDSIATLCAAVEAAGSSILTGISKPLLSTWQKKITTTTTLFCLKEKKSEYMPKEKMCECLRH